MSDFDPVIIVSCFPRDAPVPMEYERNDSDWDGRNRHTCIMMLVHDMLALDEICTELCVVQESSEGT